MSVAQVRALLGDLPKWDRQTATGDGLTKRFIVAALPIVTDSEIITVGGATQSKPAQYSLDSDLGLVIFVTAPVDGTAIVAQFAYAHLSNETITTLLGMNSNVYVAAAMGAESLAGKYAELVDKSIGDLKYSYSQKAKQYSGLAKQLRESARTSGLVATPYVGGVSIADKQTVESDSDRVEPAFRVGMHDYVTTAVEDDAD